MEGWREGGRERAVAADDAEREGGREGERERRDTGVQAASRAQLITTTEQQALNRSIDTGLSMRA